MGGLHLTGCEAVTCQKCQDTGSVSTSTGIVIGCPYCEAATNFFLKRAGFAHLIEREAQGRYIHLPPPSEAAFNPEPWQNGETYMYQEPEPVDRWPTPTRWERWRSRIKMWYRRAFGGDWQL